MNVPNFTSGDAAGLGASVTLYQTCWMGSHAISNTQGNHAIDVRSTGTMSKVFCYVIANDRGASTLVVMVNGTPGNSSVSIGASTTGQFEDTTGTDTFAATDEVNYRLITGAGGTVFSLGGCSNVWAPASVTVTYVCGTGGSLTGTADQFIAFANGAFSATRAENQHTIGVAGTLQNLFASASGNTRSEATNITVQKDDVSVNSTVQFAASTSGDVEDTSNTDAVSDGSKLNYVWAQGGGTGQLTLRVTKIEVSATNAFPIFGAFAAVTIASGLTRYFCPAGRLLNTTATEADAQIKTNVAFTWSDLYGYVSAYSLNSGNYVVQSRVNGLDGNMVLTWTATGAQSDTTNSDVVADDDEINFEAVTGGTSGSVNTRTLSSLGTGAGAGTPTIDMWCPQARHVGEQRRFAIPTGFIPPNKVN